MGTGAEVAKNLLIQVRDGGLSGPIAAGMLHAALPGSKRYRQEFLGVLGEYLSTALEGAATDPELLG